MDLESLLDSLIKIYPTLQISIPELEEMSAESWDAENDELWVALVDSRYDDQSTEVLIAYDSEGNEHLLSADEEPDHLVMVVGPSERVVAIHKDSVPDWDNGANGRVQVVCEPVLETTEYYYYEYETLQNCTDPIDPGDGGGSGGGTGGGGSSCQRVDDYRYDYLNKAKFLSKDKLREVEDWALGKPDMYVQVVNINISEGYNITQLRTINVGKDGWYSSNWLGGIKDLKEKNIDMTTWLSFNKRIHGYQVYFYWAERDISSTEIRTYHVSSQFDPEDWSTSSSIQGWATATIHKQDDNAGVTFMEYCDPVSGEGTKYSTPYLYFYVNRP